MAWVKYIRAMDLYILVTLIMVKLKEKVFLSLEMDLIILEVS